MAEASEVTSTQFEDEPKGNPEAPPVDPTHSATKSGSRINSNFYQRTWTTIAMILTFGLILSAGQFYTVLLIQFLNITIFIELNNIKRYEEKEVKIPMTKFINWFLFFTYNYYLFGKFIQIKLPYLGIKYNFIGKMLFYHPFISFSLVVIAFLTFVISLKQGFLKYQFRLFGWIVISLLICSSAAWLMSFNVYEGLIYFLLPAMLIVINDIFAYLFGYFFGKHQLIALSPKKTWEGYIGGAISTCIFSIILTEAIQSMTGTLCPSPTFDFTPFVFPSCNNHLLTLFKLGPITITYLQGHCMIFSLFASTIGPFGGFFASGLKRSVKIKDFGNSIPGHGGVSDRMDCQMIMGAFVYFYYQAFMKVTIISTPAYIISLLNPEEQLNLFNMLKTNLISMKMI